MNPRPFAVEVTELVYACVNLKLRHSRARMGGNLSEKKLCWIDPRTEAATPKVFPDPSHGEGEVMTSPEVT